MYEAFPLQWPTGYNRTAKRVSSSFKMTPDKARVLLIKEIVALSGDKNPIISSNVPLRKDGQMYADMASDQIKDPGVAVYFVFNGVQISIACDAWLTPSENIRALGLTVEAMRGMDRWKCSDVLNRSFTGFTALPHASTIVKDTWTILGLKVQPNTKDEVVAAYKEQAKKLHPDAGGTHHEFVELQEAYNKALSFYQT